ncbi:MAG: dTMP kinase [Planctomycetes bacterium]|nr:dTMP kinase [Planctomycetota bacterium]
MTYVVLEGPDGCGKSSQAVGLAAWLRDQGHSVVHVREPGSTPVGESLRQLLLARATGDLRPITEALLFSAARAELVANVVAPALRRGEVVVAERCYLSTIVYQSIAQTPGLDLDWVLDLTRRVHGAHLPDAIFVLDVAADVALARRRARDHDRIEARGDGYHERVRAAFVQVVALEARAQRIDAARSFDAVQADLRERVRGLLR